MLYDLEVNVVLIKSAENKADALTRIAKKWTKRETKVECCVTQADVIESHNQHHLGVERTMYVIRQSYPTVKKTDVEKVVRECERCKRIDPNPIRMEEGTLGIGVNWYRLSMDVTTLAGKKYLTLVDCGPSRFAIWRLIKNETERELTAELSSIFFERGFVRELVLDNSGAFRANAFKEWCEKYGLKLNYRCAYKPSGNGIVERHHKTIKRMVARTGGEVQEQVYWYNQTPKSGQKGETVPFAELHTYECKRRQRGRTIVPVDEECEYGIGDLVWVKPASGRCTEEWSQGKVTGVNSKWNVEIDGMPRHVKDLRMRNRGEER